MFSYTLENNYYFIKSDKIKGKYGPFIGIYIKNKYLGKINKEKIDEKKYPGYKYSIGIGKNGYFIIGLNGIVDIIS